MNTTSINNILTITLLGMILTSNANASSCPGDDVNLNTIRENTAMIAAIIENAPAANAQVAVKKESNEQRAIPAQLQIDTDMYPSLKVLESDGILSANPISRKAQLNNTHIGRVVMINKCFSLTVRHQVDALALEQGQNSHVGQKVYGSFGRSCNGNSDFKAAGVAMSVFALPADESDWAVLKIEDSQKSKIQGFKFANLNGQELELDADVIVAGASGSTLNDPSTLRYQSVRALKYAGGSMDSALWTRGGRGMGGVSGGGAYVVQKKQKGSELVLAGLHLGDDSAVMPIVGLIDILYRQDKAKYIELRDSFKKKECP